MKVVALTRTSRIGPSSRYRIEQYLPLLRERGITVELRPLFGGTWFAILEIRSAPLRLLAKGAYALARLPVRMAQTLAAGRGDADLVLVEQQLFPYLPAWIELLLWPRRQPTILEFDDALWLTFAHRRKLERLCGHADLVITGNRFLADFAARQARHVAVIPTTVDPGRAPSPPAGGPRPWRVGWIGLRYNLGSLALVARPLQRLAAAGVDLELRVISSALPDPAHFPGVRLVHRPWSEAGEREELEACDIGIMPLPDDDWSRGKCALKLLQFMAAGRPVVASPVGVNAELVRDGENGLLASGEPGWTSALRRLHDDAELARRLGAEGRRTVEQGWSREQGARLVEAAWSAAVARGTEPG